MSANQADYICDWLNRHGIELSGHIDDLTLAARLEPVDDWSPDNRPMTQFGGWPRLPADLPWPHGGPDFKPLHHLAQIDFSELPDYPGREIWPKVGTLWLFADLDGNLRFTGQPAAAACDSRIQLKLRMLQTKILAAAAQGNPQTNPHDRHAVLFSPNSMRETPERRPPVTLQVPSPLYSKFFDPWLPPDMQMTPAPMRFHAVPVPFRNEGEFDIRRILSPVDNARLNNKSDDIPIDSLPNWCAGPLTRREAWILFQRAASIDPPAWNSSRAEWDWASILNNVDYPAWRHRLVMGMRPQSAEKARQCLVRFKQRYIDFADIFTKKLPDEPIEQQDIDAMVAIIKLSDEFNHVCDNDTPYPIDGSRSFQSNKDFLQINTEAFYQEPAGNRSFWEMYKTDGLIAVRWLNLYRLAGFGLISASSRKAWPDVQSADNSCHWMGGRPAAYYDSPIKSGSDVVLMLNLSINTGWPGFPGEGDICMLLVEDPERVARQEFTAARLWLSGS